MYQPGVVSRMAAPDTSPADRVDSPADRVDSNWWYVVALMPVLSLLGFLVFSWVAAAAVFSFGFGAVGGGMMGPGMVAAPLMVLFVPLFLLGTVGTALTVLFPVAVYLDAKAVAAADVGWDPDPTLYALVAVVGIVATAFLLDLLLSGYYLYRRHQYVGTP